MFSVLFSVLVRKNLIKLKRLVFFFHIEYFVRTLVFCYLSSSKTLIKRVFGNDIMFLDIGWFFFLHFGVLLPKMGKNTHNKRFGYVALFLHIECYSCVLAFWYLWIWKTLNSFFFSVLMPNILKKKKNPNDTFLGMSFRYSK